MKLQYRILLVQLPALSVIIILLVWGRQTVGRLGAESDRILADNYRSVLAAERMKASLERLNTAAVFAVMGEAGRSKEGIALYQQQFDTELNVEISNITEEGEMTAAMQLKKDWEAYLASYNHFLSVEAELQHDLYFSTLLPAFESVHTDADQILTLNQDAMVRKSDAARLSAAAAQHTWLAWALLGMIGAVGLGVALARRLAEPLGAISGAARRVGEGDLDARLPQTQVEELDALADAFNTMSNRLRLYRRANDSELARARESAQAAIESLMDPVLVLTPRAEVRASNGAARRILGLAVRDRRLDGCAPEIFEAIQQAFNGVMETGCAVRPEDFSKVVVLAQADGECVLLPYATPINDTVSGELVGVTVLLQDVTRLRRLDELKGNLVQTVAHELRTPLTSLGMALHLALDERVSGPLDERLLGLLVTAKEDVLRLRALVEDLLDLSRIQAGRILLRREVVEPLVLLNDVRDTLLTTAERASVGVVVEVASDIQPISLDRARMQLALSNLVANAIRYAPPLSSVYLRAVTTAVGLQFEVEDAGPGVALDDREKIFDAFVQGKDAGASGAGLGLYIVREVIRAHAGRLGVGEGAHKGARFWLEIPRGLDESL